MKDTLKDIKEYADLYGFNTTLERLKKYYSFTAFAQNSVPTLGSPTFNINKLNPIKEPTISKVIIHKNNEITLKTNLGFIRFIQ